MDQRLKQDKQVCLFYRNLATSWIFTSSSLVLTSIDFGIDTKLNSRLLCYNKCLRQGIKNWHSVLNRVGKSEIRVLNRVRVWAAGPHLPTRDSVKYPPPPPPGGRNKKENFSYTSHLLKNSSKIHTIFCNRNLLVHRQKGFWQQNKIRTVTDTVTNHL